MISARSLMVSDLLMIPERYRILQIIISEPNPCESIFGKSKNVGRKVIEIHLANSPLTYIWVRIL